MEKRSTGKGAEGMGAWTVGMDLGDRTSHVCVLDEAGTVVERNNFTTTDLRLDGDACRGCGERIPGLFSKAPARFFRGADGI